MSDDFQLIQSLGRDKLSKLVSYPVGAEALSRALEGVPQYSELRCSFHSRYAHQKWAQAKLIMFLSLAYTRREAPQFASQYSHDRGMFEPYWRIDIHAVPVDIRAEIKRMLIEGALENIGRPWLVANENLTGRIGYAALFLQYDREKRLIRVKEQWHVPPERLSQ